MTISAAVNPMAKYNQPDFNDNRTPFSQSSGSDDLDNQVWALQHPEDDDPFGHKALEAEIAAQWEGVEAYERPCVKVSVETLQPIVKPDALRERLIEVNLDNLSPIEALTLLYELKRLV